MGSTISALQAARAAYQPRLPRVYREGSVTIALGEPTAPAQDQEQIRRLFPRTYAQPVATVVAGEGAPARPLKVGVVLSGGQAPGGHNVIAGLYDALLATDPHSELYGFLEGPAGIMNGRCERLTAAKIDAYRNTGGFDMIKSGRDKIEGDMALAACRAHLSEMALDGLVVIGGDDSNTNAAVLAENLKAKGQHCVVVGVPKTIDGDMKNEQIEASFGFDTACKTYAELIGNISRDCTSAVKYWHFIKLMGRAASHVTLECGLQTHPNICLISEEVAEKGQTLSAVVDYIASVVRRRAQAGRNYGILLVPEGIIEFMPDLRLLLEELSRLVSPTERDLAGAARAVAERLTPPSAALYALLPPEVRVLLLRRDSHGNLMLSQVETERLLADMVAERIKALENDKPRRARTRFSYLCHFLGYEGRSAFPSNFDADYTYSLGYTAAQFVRAGLTGYTVHVRGMLGSAEDWVPGGTPVTMMLNMELRGGEPTPVIQKTLVDLLDKPMKEFMTHRNKWEMDDDYVAPGPIQYYGPSEVCDQPTLTLRLERG